MNRTTLTLSFICMAFLRVHGQESDPHAVFPPERSVIGSEQTVVQSPAFLNLNLSSNAGPQNEPTVRISRANRNIVVAAWRDFRLGFTNPIIRRIGYARSTDGGATWGTSQLLPDPAPTYVSQSDPVLTSDTAGNFYLSSTSRKSNAFPQDRDQIVYKSTDSGESFFFLGVAMASAGGGGEDKEWMFCDPVPSNATHNALMMTSTNTVNGIIRFAKSTDEGVQWTSPVNVSTTSGGTGSNLATGTDGAIHIVWSQGGIRYDRSTNGGASFGTDVQIRNATVNGFPFVCVDYSGNPSRGNVYVVWSDNSGGTYDVWFQRSTDSGTNWLATPVRVNDIVTNSQWWPAVQCDTNGYLSVVYYDNRTGTGIWNSYLAWSTDAGATWTNTSLSDTSFFGLQPNPDVRYGDYIGIDAFAGAIVPVWTDDRAGSFNQEIYSAVASIALSVDNQEPPLARGFSLAQNYPNPFNPKTVIKFQVPRQNDGGQASSKLVNLRVYDVLGREVANLVNEEMNPGTHTVQWDATGVASGVYLYRLQTGGGSQTMKMLLVK